MKISERLPSILVIGVLVMGAGVVGWSVFSPSTEGALVDVKVPELSQAALAGKKAFDTSCAQCHGPNAAGGAQGPPLVHDIYNPGHHADAAFVIATKRGTRQHHWKFGNMPPVPGVSNREIAAIIRYVRELQQANGIFYRPHRM
jgi:mono/diheme cytochrome c family protein